MSQIAIADFQRVTGLVVQDCGDKTGVVDARDKFFEPRPEGLKEITYNRAIACYDDTLDVAGKPVELEPTITLGGWWGWHRDQWEGALWSAAATAGVELEMKVLEESWWHGTRYRLVVKGPPDAVKRFDDWYQRRLRAWYAASG